MADAGAGRLLRPTGWTEPRLRDDPLEATRVCLVEAVLARVALRNRREVSGRAAMAARFVDVGCKGTHGCGLMRVVTACGNRKVGAMTVCVSRIESYIRSSSGAGFHRKEKEKGLL